MRAVDQGAQGVRKEISIDEWSNVLGGKSDFGRWAKIFVGWIRDNAGPKRILARDPHGECGLKVTAFV